MHTHTALLSVTALVACLALGRAAEAQPLGDGSFDLRLGPSVGILDASGTQLRVSARFGYNVLHGSSTRAVLEAPLELGLGAGYTYFGVLPGVRVEIPLVPNVPLYLTPSAGVGVGVAAGGGNAADVALGFRAGVGVRYVFQNRFALTFDPLNVELYPVGFGGAVPGFYTMMFGAGTTF